MRIAVVSCVEATEDLIRRTLSEQGAELSLCRDCQLGPAAVEHVRAPEIPYDLVIVEHPNPEVDGFAFLDALPRITERPVLMATTWRRKADLERARNLGALLISKPVERHELLHAIGVALDTGRVALGDTALERPREHLHILLAEDSQDNSLLIETHLARAHIACTTVRNGREAVNAVKSGRFDLVLMDVQMPLLDGYGATEEIRRWEREEGRRPTPIVALTAHALREYEDKSRQAGCDGHVTKPVTKRRLFEAIRTYAGV